MKTKLISLLLIVGFSFVFPFKTNAQCVSGEDQWQLLYSNDGNDIVTQSSVLDTYDVPAGMLEIGDLLFVTVAQNGTTPGNMTLSASPGGYVLTGNITVPASSGTFGTATLSMRAGSDNQMQSYTSLSGFNVAANSAYSFNGAWQLNLRDSTTGSTNNQWHWTVYKLTGTQDCMASGAVGSGTGTVEAIDRQTDFYKTGFAYGLFAILMLVFAVVAFYKFKR